MLAQTDIKFEQRDDLERNLSNDEKNYLLRENSLQKISQNPQRNIFEKKNQFLFYFILFFRK